MGVINREGDNPNGGIIDLVLRLAHDPAASGVPLRAGDPAATGSSRTAPHKIAKTSPKLRKLG